MLNQFDSGQSLVRRGAVVALEHALESPLCPFVVNGVTSANFAFPVQAEANLIQL
jgi:hypothetical protein